MTKLEKWTYPDSYMGETYYEYYIVAGQSRDSTYLEQSNFIVATKRLGGENPPNVIIARASHWLVGWVEALMVHESATEELVKAQDIRDEIDEEGILDWDHYEEMRSEEVDRIREEIKRDVENDLEDGKTECHGWGIDLTKSKEDIDEEIDEVADECVR